MRYYSCRLMVRTSGFHPVNLGSSPSESVLFRWLFYYWFNTTDKPSVVARLNLWAFVNLRLFKVKINNFIVFFILGLNNLKIKELKIMYKDWTFEVLYFKLIQIFFFFILFIYILFI